ncbi:MAG: cysteine-rich CWC family protein [Mariprofundaceae bacterium]|nr:cysteine-rich CWC family protein [Mariprofundaceae bacterium]
MVALIDPNRCPLCGEPNDCAMACCQSADEKVSCWCRSEQFPQTLLDQVPSGAVRRACICRRCLRAEQFK